MARAMARGRMLWLGLESIHAMARARARGRMLWLGLGLGVGCYG